MNISDSEIHDIEFFYDKWFERDYPSGSGVQHIICIKPRIGGRYWTLASIFGDFLDEENIIASIFIESHWKRLH